MLRTIISALLVSVLLTLGAESCGKSKVPTPPPELSETINFEVTFSGDHHETTASVHLEAVDQHGNRGMMPNSQSYPLDTQVFVPWEHTIYYEPPLIVKATLTMKIDLGPGEKAICFVRWQGISLPPVAVSVGRGQSGQRLTLVCGN